MKDENVNGQGEAPESERGGGTQSCMKMFLGKGLLQPLNQPLSSRIMMHKPGHTNLEAQAAHTVGTVQRFPRQINCEFFS